MPQTIKITLPNPHSGQRRVLSEAQRFNIVCCGRRWGKTKMAVGVLSKPALDGKPVAYLTPTYKMLTEVWREMRQTLGPIASRIDTQQNRIELLTGGVLDMWSLDAYESIRGRKYATVVIDEAAMVPNLSDAWDAAIRPTLTDLRGRAWLLSTPRGHNFFKQCFDRGIDTTQPDWASWQMPTTSNPYIDPAEVESARLELPERTFAQEYLAQFLEDGGGVFRNVLECSTGSPQTPQEGRSYVIGVDLAKSVDFSVFSVWDVLARREVWLDRSNRVDYEVQIQRLVALCERYKPIACIVESNSIGTPVIERLQRLGVKVQPFTTTNASKTAIVDGMVLGLERRDVTLLDDHVGKAEMLAYEMERLPSGLFRYSAPENAHDDVVMARMFAYYGITSVPQSFSFSYSSNPRTAKHRAN